MKALVGWCQWSEITVAYFMFFCVLSCTVARKMVANVCCKSFRLPNCASSWLISTKWKVRTKRPLKRWWQYLSKQVKGIFFVVSNSHNVAALWLSSYEPYSIIFLNMCSCNVTIWSFECSKSSLITIHNWQINGKLRSYPPELKMRTYLRIAQLALEYGDAADAEAFVNRASMLQNDAKNEQLNVMYKVRLADFASSSHLIVF